MRPYVYRYLYTSLPVFLCLFLHLISLSIYLFIYFHFVSLSLHTSNFSIYLLVYQISFCQFLYPYTSLPIFLPICIYILFLYLPIYYWFSFCQFLYPYTSLTILCSFLHIIALSTYLFIKFLCVSFSIHTPPYLFFMLNSTSYFSIYLSIYQYFCQCLYPYTSYLSFYLYVSTSYSSNYIPIYQFSFFFHPTPLSCHLKRDNER